MLIATLLQVQQEEMLKKMVGHPLVKGVRYNTGYYSPFTPQETLERIVEITKEYGKKLWVDIEGRQMRIAQWSYPLYGGRVMVNRPFDVQCPAEIYFRGDGWYPLKQVSGKEVFLGAIPEKALGQGQTVNVRGDNFQVLGNYLTAPDIDYVNAACDFGIFNFMLSFLEKWEDVAEVDKIVKKHPNYNPRTVQPEYVWKPETLKGLELVRNCSLGELRAKNCRLMAPRDDLSTNIGHNKAEILKVLEEFICLDPETIVASRIFSSLEYKDEVSMGDWSDLYLMHLLGYKHFMLSDNICQWYFDEAMTAWGDFIDVWYKKH